MKAQELLKAQFEQAHDFLGMTIADCTQEVLNHRLAGSTVNPIGGVYTHVAVAEDMLVNGLIRGAEPIIASDGWAAKLGVEEPGPFQTPEYMELIIDLPVVQECAKVVLASVGNFLTTASEEDLAKSVDTPLGTMPAITFLSNVASTHVAEHWGEIAALKGMQGLKGLSF